ncbi:unnamed protein product [Adineta steineri]|uniref:Uncharacterized protein n=1 Tax=Adineta steineri TaxID=433720 RepID=A0A815VDP5_9BILA|nr:unnamed protein product [Adineta steineri]CAF4060858.1 unnamed protein product [Adineta steineri]
MATSLAFNSYENDDHTRLLDNYRYLAERRCLKQHTLRTPLALRRSVSLEDSSTDPIINSTQNSNEQSSNHLLPSLNPQLSSSLNSLCVKLRRYQLLPEYNKDIEKISDENNFSWWTTANHLRTMLEKLIMTQQRKTSHAPGTYIHDEEITFRNCKRQGRRNGVCLEVDRLYYNDQLVLFATIANEVQLEYNLLSSGFKI